MTVELITVFILVGIFAVVAAALVALLYWQCRQRATAESSNRELQSWVKCLYDKSPDATFAVSHRLVIRSFNPQAAAMLGYSSNELLGRTIGSVLPALLGLGTGKLTPHVSRTDKGLEVEAEARRKDGCAVPVKAWVTEGRAQGRRFFLVTLRDVKPAIASATNKLNEERETFTKLLDFSGAAVLKLDEAGQVTGFNEAAQFFTGYKIEELQGRTFWESLFEEQHRPEARHRFIALKQTGVEQRHNAIWRKKDGSVCEVAFLIKRSLDSVLLVAVEAAEPHAKALGAAQKLAVGVATEFADVLTVINGYGELLIDSAGESLREDLEQIRDAAQRGSTVTGELLAFGQRLPMEPKSIQLNHLINDNTDLFRSICGSKACFASAFEAGLGPIFADPILLCRGVGTLISYLADRQSGDGTITIRTMCDSVSGETAAKLGLIEGDYAVCSITDQVLPSDLAPVASDFVPFANGAGGALHLAAVYGLTKQNGGLMLRESGKLTTFHLYFPLAMQLQTT